jgi:hypothetical protein
MRAPSALGFAALFALPCVLSVSASAMATQNSDHRSASQRPQSYAELRRRLVTRRGVIRVLRPSMQKAPSRIVVYVHGYRTDVDRAWRDHRLAEQFLASKQAAIFVAVAAPKGGRQSVPFPRLAPILRHLRPHLKRIPRRIIAVGHSGAYRTLVGWLGHPALTHVVLLDALYAYGNRFRNWLTRASERRLTVVTRGTLKKTRALAASIRGARWLRRIPRTLGRRSRSARALFLQSQFSHMGIVKSRRVIPLLLKERLPALRRAGTNAAAIDLSGALR